MKKIFLFFFFLVFSIHITGQGIDFVYTWNKAQRQARKENKLIFVDVMADWCGPCKRMIEDINSDPAIYTYFNENFINLQINEKYQRQFLRTYKICEFPTLMFMSSEGKVFDEFQGFRGLEWLNELALSHQANWAKYSKQSIAFTNSEDGELEENYFIEEILKSLALLPLELQQKKLLDYLRQGEPYAHLIMKNFGHGLVYEDFYAFLKKETTQSNIIADKLMVSFLLSDDNYMMDDRIQKESYKIAKITGLDAMQCMAFMFVYKEFVLLRQIEMESAPSMLVYARSLLQKYPDVNDFELLYDVLAYIILNEEGEKFYVEMQPSFEKLSIEKNHFLYDDFLSVIYFKTNQKDLVAEQVNKAMLKSQNYVDVFDPFLSKFRNVLSPE
jgi:thiol-disulfide isomerase/thioredoxin